MTATVKSGSSTRPLTEAQAKILRYIVRYWGENMAPPSIREIAAAMGISSPNGVVCHLRALHAKGAIVWESMAVDGKRKEATARGIIVPELQAAAERAAAEYLDAMKEGK